MRNGGVLDVKEAEEGEAGFVVVVALQTQLGCDHPR